MGAPVLTDIWVDPVRGSDASDGLSKDHPLRTITSAWNRIPKAATLSRTGYRIWLMPGDYHEDDMPNFWESRYATFQFPIILQAYGGEHTSILHAYIDMYDTKYVYFIDLDIITDRGYGGGGNVLHLSKCEHVLIRRCNLSGFDGSTRQTQETLKANQVKYIYVEDCEISGAFWFSLDFVAVQYGHIVGCKIYNAGDWCMVLKGGSAYLLVEGNEIFDGETGGFTAGQGTGFNWMVSPWLHYEAYDLKFINNIVHDTGIAGVGVNGGYNILIAYNTLYKVGTTDHAIEIVHGSRSCDGDSGKCLQYNAAGGWGGSGLEGQYIPCRNIYIYNNIIYNPAGYQSRWQTFVIRGAIAPLANSNVPSPSEADHNLKIKGNFLWNGPPADPDLPLLGDGSGCVEDNPTCNIKQLMSNNSINMKEPQLADPENGNFKPAADGNVFGITTYNLPAFPGGDMPEPPLAPEGDLLNDVLIDFNGNPRTKPGIPGAFAGGELSGIPSMASGPVSGYTGISYIYSTSSNYPANEDLKFTFNWGDGSTTDTSFMDPGKRASASHIWKKAKKYQVAARATGRSGVSSGWSKPLSVTVVLNNPPRTPSKPFGSAHGYVGKYYIFTSSATDPDGNKISYTFNWGDGTKSTTGFVNSGTKIKSSHRWSKSGTFQIKVSATDSRGASSGWSTSLVVRIINP
jgi:hypothetical protein